MAASEKKGKTIRSEAREVVNHVNPYVNEKQWKKSPHFTYLSCTCNNSEVLWCISDNSKNTRWMSKGTNEALCTQQENKGRDAKP